MINIKPIIIDNWYTKKELKNIIKELDYYQSAINLENASENCAKEFDTKKPLASSHRIYPEKYFTMDSRNVSFVLRYIDKFRDVNFHKYIENVSNVYDSFKLTNKDTTMISYYENSDYYKKHLDISMFTVLIWVNKEKKRFKGGDLILPDLKKTIEYKNNRLVLFPSFVYHEVTQVKTENKIKKGYGRYTITHFFTHT